MSEYLFTSESVTEGHPDKLCDQVSDGILDALIKGDKGSRVACETLTKTGFVMVAGEVTSSAQIDIPKIVRGVVKEIGYSDSDDGLRLADLRRDGGARAAVARHRPGRRRQGRLHPRRAGGRRPGDDVRLRLRRDARADAAADHDGAQAVEEAGRRAQEGRGRLPAPRRQEPGLGPLLERRSAARHRRGGRLDPAQRRGQVQDAQRGGDGGGRASRCCPPALVSNKTKFFINPTGRFVVGGPMGDSGLTGRKIIVDTYGGMGRHGGGAFSGKDPSKVDRSACYYARYIAKNVVAAGLARRCEVQVAYAIGVAEPVVAAGRTPSAPGRSPRIAWPRSCAPTSTAVPARSSASSTCCAPIYQKTAAYGHFGRQDGDFFWEKTNKADALKSAARKFVAANGHANGGAKRQAARRARKRRADRARSRAAVSSAPVSARARPCGPPRVRRRGDVARELRTRARGLPERAPRGAGRRQRCGAGRAARQLLSALR